MCIKSENSVSPVLKKNTCKRVFGAEVSYTVA